MPNIYEGFYKGLSDSKYSGIRGSFNKLVGIDGNSIPGILQVHQKLAKDSGTTVDAFVKFAVAASDGSTIWFSNTSGKIWRRTSAGVWSLVHTTTPAAGAAGVTGAAEYDGYLYWATESRLHRKPTTDLSVWTDVTEDWATFDVTDDTFHPMVKQNTYLFIGDGNQLARVDNEGASGAHQFSSNKFDINAPHRISALIAFDIDILVGTFIHANVNECQVLRWDTESSSWSGEDDVPENGINAFIRDDNFVYVQAGRFGKIYFYDGEQLIPFKRIPGDWSPTKTAIVHGGSTATFLTVPVFGLSNDSGNPTEEGIYSFGSYSKDYAKSMDLSYFISQDKTASIETGAILAVGGDLFVAWKDGSNYGVDKRDTANKYASAYLETMMLNFGEARNDLKTVIKIFANYADLPANTSITFKTKKASDTGSYTTETSITDTILKQVRAEISIPEVANLQLRVDLGVSGNAAPKIETIGYDMN